MRTKATTVKAKYINHNLNKFFELTFTDCTYDELKDMTILLDNLKDKANKEMEGMKQQRIEELKAELAALEN